MSTPGRHCPLHYRTAPAALDREAEVTAETLYLIGGLYGNTAALDAVEQLAAEETERGLPAPTLVFNGDFNWFNAEPDTFRAINQRVLRHAALQGNVEAELASPDSDAGCGCAYPEWVDDATVARSNAIMERLQGTARLAPELVAAFAPLPRQLVAEVAGLRVGIIHGDPASVAGWGLAVENMPSPGETPPQIRDWFRAAAVDVFACTHTCLPFAQEFRVDDRERLVMNNGATGMPNFHGDRRGVITRISHVPCPEEYRLYGVRRGGVYCDAVALEWACAAWECWFGATWPPGSPAAVSYGPRLAGGPAHTLADAFRLTRRGT